MWGGHSCPPLVTVVSRLKLNLLSPLILSYVVGSSLSFREAAVNSPSRQVLEIHSDTNTHVSLTRKLATEHSPIAIAFASR